MMFRPLPVMTVCVIAALGVLAMLGNWQWQRYHEKQDAVSIEHEWESFLGQPVDEQVFFISTLINGRSAWKHVGVFQDGQRGAAVLVTHFITFQTNPPETVTYVEATEFRSEEGVFITPSKPGFFTPKPNGNTYFAYDVESIRARLPDPIAQSLRCLLYTSPSPRDQRGSRMPSSA